MSSADSVDGLKPIADNVWVTEAGTTHLIGGRDANGKTTFPIPDTDDGKAMDVVKLSPTGTLWSFTRQDFKPKPPYDGPEEFTPFLLGYIELPEVIVQAHIVDTTLEALALGMEMELVIVPFDDTRSNYAFRPAQP